ncbi:restriction endonuclease subunit S [Enterococcus faecalis]|nr:restriction endonuclease subunit S [Enterococcus faecalis]EIA6407147.1 restriction endonuclease subunit S [Enterococcus faecalis]EJX8071906.1 restriction endonuclease subunit S [Enterococcus faecalis]
MNLLIVFTLISVWELCKLGTLAEIVRGASPRPIQDSKWFDNTSDVGWLRISDVTEQNGRIYKLEQKLSKAGQEKTRVLRKPHLLLSIAATVGKPVVNYVNTGVHDGFLIFLNPLFDREFMFQWLEMFTPKWQKYGQPGSQLNLNSELVRNQELRMPSTNEQEKIGMLFQYLDDTITLHQRKLDQLKKLKKAYLQEMFVSINTKNNKVPKLRFANFEGNWELCKLENIIEKQIKGKAKVENLCNGSVEYLDANRLNGGKPIYTKALPDVSERDIIILWDGSKAGKVYYGFKGVLGSTLKAYQLKECANSQFIYQQLLDNQNNIYNNYRTPNIPHVVKNFSSIFPIWMTSFEEQSQMADILSNLDNRIILQQNLTDTMISLKKSYLQNMFI